MTNMKFRSIDSMTDALYVASFDNGGTYVVFTEEGLIDETENTVSLRNAITMTKAEWENWLSEYTLHRLPPLTLAEIVYVRDIHFKHED